MDRTYFELNQEYTHLTEIHWRGEHHAYCRYNHNGDLEHTVSITSDDGPDDASLVSFKWQPLEEYLVVSNASLVRLFDFTLYRPGAFLGWDTGDEEQIDESSDLYYRRKVMPSHAAYTRGIQILRPRCDAREVRRQIARGWRGAVERSYMAFIACDWRNERVCEISTDPAATTNYFDAKDNALPFELSPAFFRAEVLLKYKGDRDKYTVGEREVTCRSAWHLRGIDVNEAGQVHAYICYLRALPYAEQLHWKSFNESLKAPISVRAFATDFRGEFANAVGPLQRVLRTVGRWDKVGVSWWTLRDRELMQRVSIPFTASRDEWAEAFMDLSKLVVEGFEVRALRSSLDAAGVPYDRKNEQSLTLLEKRVRERKGSEWRLTGLRTVQEVRSKVKGHVSGRAAQEMVRQAIARHGSFADHFRYVCEQISQELETIHACLS